MATRRVGLVRRSIERPDTMYYFVRDKMLGFLIETGEEVRRRSGGRVELVDLDLVRRLQRHVDEAEAEGEPLVPFVVFWWLCTALDAFMSMVREQETAGRDRPRTEAQMLKLEQCARSLVQDVKIAPYRATNARQLLEAAHDLFNLALLQGRHEDVARAMLDPSDLEDQFGRLKDAARGEPPPADRLEGLRRYQRQVRASVDALLSDQERSQMRRAADEAMRMRRERRELERRRRGGGGAIEERATAAEAAPRSRHVDGQEEEEEGARDARRGSPAPESSRP